MTVQTDLSRTWSVTLKTGFLVLRLNYGLTVCDLFPCCFGEDPAVLMEFLHYRMLKEMLKIRLNEF